MTKISLPVKIIVAVLACLLVGFLSGMSTSDAIENWYAFLEKPSFNPPNWLFAPVWTTLYIMMGIAVALVWHQGWEKQQVRKAVILFTVQLLFNGAWSIVFFGLQSPVAALVIIVILLILIFSCIRLFLPIYKWAAYLLVPYLLWVSFATVLNTSIVWLN